MESNGKSKLKFAQELLDYRCRIHGHEPEVAIEIVTDFASSPHSKTIVTASGSEVTVWGLWATYL